MNPATRLAAMMGAEFSERRIDVTEPDAINYAAMRLHGWRRNDPEKRPKELRCMDALLATITAQAAEIERLNRLLDKYGGHRRSCRSLPMDLRNGGDCECGWQHARAARAALGG